ncbi:28231_t:CDS:1 [Dentiscutata erythropus]|uniref:28231_t:CDS:1 n=1 Tax=Dentiscutata erythropus TaxID=1348616 RepID=A0A9N9KEI3_9GLOM|nr:28231_t:CDS:1 [Dentiscutata erythropus]
MILAKKEYVESSDDSDMEDDEEVNFIGLTYKLLHQVSYIKYKITSEGIRNNLILVIWEMYDQFSYCFDPVKRKKSAQERYKTTGLNFYYWCDEYLETSQDICKVCEEYQQDHKIISIIP